MAGYRPMTLADLAGYLSRAADDRTRWKLTWEFLEEYRWVRQARCSLAAAGRAGAGRTRPRCSGASRERIRVAVAG